MPAPFQDKPEVQREPYYYYESVGLAVFPIFLIVCTVGLATVLILNEYGYWETHSTPSFILTIAILTISLLLCATITWPEKKIREYSPSQQRLLDYEKQMLDRRTD